MDRGQVIPAAAALERQVGSPITGGCCLERFAAAEFALEGGRLDVARRALTDMERYAKSPEARASKSGDFRVWPLILGAQIAAREQSASTAERLRRLDSAMVDWQDDQGSYFIYGNLIAARLHEARREYAEALAAVQRRDPWTSPVAVTYHREECRIAAEAGDTAGAIRACERYLRIRGDAEARLQPEVQQVRAALTALRTPDRPRTP